MFNYSQQLMKKYQNKMKKTHGIFVDDDMAQMHLESFATLFLSLKPEIAEANFDVRSKPSEQGVSMKRSVIDTPRALGTSTKAKVDSAIINNSQGLGLVLPPTPGNGKK
jgi:hypothetical protein